MKRYFTTFICMVLCLSLFICKHSTDIEKQVNVYEEAGQIIVFFAYHNNSYRDAQSGKYISAENVYGIGEIHSDSLPLFEYYKIGIDTFYGENIYQYFPGYLSFGNSDSRTTSSIDFLDVEIKTSFGKMIGSISLPKSVYNLTASELDTLELNQPITIYWSESNADFYSVYCSYSWRDESGYFNYISLDSLICDTSITFPGSIFIHDGSIGSISIQPINGPIPQAFTRGNMNGEGQGFLYYYGDSKTYLGNTIIVGAGNKNQTVLNKSTISQSNELIKIKFTEKLKKLLLFN